MISKSELTIDNSKVEAENRANAIVELTKLAEQFPEIGIENIKHIFIGRIKKINISNVGFDYQKVGTGLHHIFGIKNGFGKLVPASIQTHRYGIYSAELSVVDVHEGGVTYYPKCDAEINMIRSHFFPDSLSPVQILQEIQNALGAIKKYFTSDVKVTEQIMLENSSSIQQDLTQKNTIAYIYRLGTNHLKELVGLPFKIIIDPRFGRVVTVYPIIFIKKEK